MGAKSIVFLFLVALATSHAQEPKGPCCYPDEFVITYGTELGIMSSFGKPSVAFIHAMAAFDFTNERQGDDGILVIYGQTPKDFKLIRDYAKGIQYTIDRGQLKCDKTKLEGPMKNCLAAGSSFNTTQYLGDKQLYTESYYYHTLTPQQQGQSVVTVTQRDCLPTGFRLFAKTGRTSILSSTGFFNYVGGIADPDAFFDVPAYCPSEIAAESKLLKQLNQLNYQRLPF